MATKNRRMLKEYLQQDVTSIHNNSSTGFESIPRRIIPDDNHSGSTKVRIRNLPRSRSRSRAAAEAAFGSFQKLLNACRSFHYSSTPSNFPRSVSRRLLGRWYMKNNNKKLSSNDKESSSVKVKDILRWKSFRDLDSVDNQPLDYVGPVDDSPTTSESGSSWGDSDFTVTEEELPCCLGNSGDDEGKNWDDEVDDGGVAASDSDVGPKEDKHNITNEEDKEQQSPISVLNSPFRDEVSDEEYPSSFETKMANMERTKQRLLQSIQWFENLAGVNDDDETDEEEQEEHEQQREEDSATEAKSSKIFSWFKRGSKCLEEKKECMKCLEEQRQWSKFEEERKEIGVELEFEMFSDLLNEVMIDFC